MLTICKYDKKQVTYRKSRGTIKIKLQTRTQTSKSLRMYLHKNLVQWRDEHKCEKKKQQHVFYNGHHTPLHSPNRILIPTE